MIAPNSTILLDFALARVTDVISNLIMYPDNMAKNLKEFGGIHDAQRVLLFLTQRGLSRENAYTIVQRNAMRVWKSFGVTEDGQDLPNF